MSKETLTERLADIQVNLKAPKGQMNKFGGYAYRSCEDILEAVKPLLKGLVLKISDDIIVIGEGGPDQRVYSKAKVTITDGTDTEEVTASAREPKEQKGMNEAQITGSASSYARKYALNGLFLIDDTKDADATNDHGKGAAKKSPVKKAADKPAEEKKAPSKTRASRTAKVKPEAKKEDVPPLPTEEKKVSTRRGNFRKGGRGL